MESRIRILLLRGVALGLALAGASGCSMLGSKPAARAADPSAPVIQPDVERREVKPPKIDAQDFEVGGYVGLISVEDFGSNFVYGARLAYHISEGLFIEGTYAQTGDVDKTSIEAIDNIDLLGSDRKYKYYDLSLGYDLFPGEVFIGRNYSFNSALYVVAGAGNTTFGGEDLFTLTFGAGYRVLATDSVALHFDVRDHLFDNDITGEDKTTHNIEFSLGATWFF